MIVRLKLNSSEKVILRSGDSAATYKLSDISLEYDAIFEEPYATTIGELYAGTKSVPYTKVTSIQYQTLFKNTLPGKLTLTKFLLLFLDKRYNFANKNEEFYNSSIKKILATINGMPHQLFAAGLQARDLYPELKKYFYKEHSNVTWEEFLRTKFGLWIYTRSSTDNTLHGSGRGKKSGILLQIEKVAESSDGNLICHVFSLEDAVAHLAVSDPNGILTIEK